MDEKLKSKFLRAGTGGESQVSFWVSDYRKMPCLSFYARYGHGHSWFHMNIDTKDYETIIRGMLEANRDAAVLAIGKALASTFEPEQKEQG